MLWLIELVGSGREEYVVDYSSAYSSPQTTGRLEAAKWFATRAQAVEWAQRYLSAYQYRLRVKS